MRCAGCFGGEAICYTKLGVYFIFRVSDFSDQKYSTCLTFRISAALVSKAALYFPHMAIFS